MDIVIPVAQKDVFTLGKQLKYFDRNLNHPNIYIITKSNCIKYFNSFTRYAIKCINEDELIEGLTYANVKQCIEDHHMVGQRVGWYFQQFLKMAFAKSQYAKDYYVVWDADTIPLTHMSFIDDYGTFLFNLKPEYYPPYFECMDKLLGLQKQVEPSFITEHMAISTEIMRELIQKIESNSAFNGNWWQKIINSQPLNGSAGFSEFETYGTFIYTYYPQLVKFRSLATEREGREKYGLCVSKFDLHNASMYYDTISFERRVDTKPNSLTRRIMEWGYLKFCKILRKYYHIS